MHWTKSPSTGSRVLDGILFVGGIHYARTRAAVCACAYHSSSRVRCGDGLALTVQQPVHLNADGRCASVDLTSGTLGCFAGQQQQQQQHSRRKNLGTTQQPQQQHRRRLNLPQNVSVDGGEMPSTPTDSEDDDAKGPSLFFRLPQHQHGPQRRHHCGRRRRSSAAAAASGRPATFRFRRQHRGPHHRGLRFHTAVHRSGARPSAAAVDDALVVGGRRSPPPPPLPPSPPHSFRANLLYAGSLAVDAVASAARFGTSVATMIFSDCLQRGNKTKEKTIIKLPKTTNNVRSYGGKRYECSTRVFGFRVTHTAPGQGYVRPTIRFR